MILTEAQLQEAARLSVHGTSSKSLIDRFYAEHEAAGTLPDKPRADIRAEMSNELRPTREDNAKFADRKYGDIIAAEKHIRDQLWTERYSETLETLYSELQSQLEILQQRLAEMNRVLNDYYAHNDGITLPSEAATLNADVLRCNKEVREIRALMLNIGSTFGEPLKTRKIN